MRFGIESGMWLSDVSAVWAADPTEDIWAARLGLIMLRRTRLLLKDGDAWVGTHLAMDVAHRPCDPLSDQAAFFSLAGAAARARWELREDVSEFEINPVHLQQLMDTLVEYERLYQGETHGWVFVASLLEGVENALLEYIADREDQDRDGHQAA
jgi:hypothetical protein